MNLVRKVERVLETGALGGEGKMKYHQQRLKIRVGQQPWAG